MTRTGRLLNAVVIKRFEHIAALGPLQVSGDMLGLSPHHKCESDNASQEPAKELGEASGSWDAGRD